MADGPDRERPQLSEVTGELPRVVRDALGRIRAADGSGRSPADGSERSPDGSDAALVQRLVALGVDEPEARAAVDEDRVALVLARQVIGSPARYSIAEVAERSGVPAELLRRVRLASGLPLPDRLGSLDLRWAELLARLLAVLPAEAVVSLARARGTSLAMVVRSDLGVVRDELLLPMRQGGADDLSVAVALADTARELDAIAREVLQVTYGLHLEHQLGSELSATLTRSDIPEIELSVGFVDLVGWTSMSSRVDPQGLDEVIDAFEERIIEVTAPRTEVSVVKFLGDAAMLVAADALTLVEAMLELTTPVPSLEDVPLRGGIATGSTRVREGDVFGPPVNLAARLTDLARPWRLLADESLGQTLADGGFATRRLRPVRLRGIGTRRPLALTPRGDGADGRATATHG